MIRLLVIAAVAVFLHGGAFAQMTSFCIPNVSGVRSCPCNNQQVPAASTKGCDSFLNPTTVSGVGGAELAATGTATASAACTLVFHVTAAHNPPSNQNWHILWKGTSTLPAGVKNGFGVRCISGVRRAYFGMGLGSGGLGTNNAVDFPNGVQTTDAWTASQMPTAGTTLYYYSVYRDNQGPMNCFGKSDQFNTTNAGSIVWQP